MRSGAFLLVPLLVAATSPAKPAKPTAPHTPPKPPAPRILLVGDSMMKVGVAPVLRRTLAKELGFAVDVKARSATGLSRDDVFDWPKEVAKQLAKQTYERAVVMIGANDCQNITEGGKVLPFGTPAWRGAYERRLDAFLGTLCAKVGTVHWLGLPPMRNAKLNGRIKDLAAIVEPKVNASACATYVPTAGALSDATGGYTRSRRIARRRLTLREADGIHITQNGGELVWNQLKPVVVLSPPPKAPGR